MRDALRWFAILFFASALVFAGIAAAVGDVFFFRLATEALIFGGLALSVDLLLGRTGLLPLGHTLFFGIGAYSSALVLKHLAANFWLALGISLLASALAGLVGGIIAIRSKGVYCALISFGLAQVVSKVVFNTRELGASDGLIGVPTVQALPGVATNDPAGFFLFTLAFIGVVYGALAYLMGRPFGRQLDAIRSNEHRMAFLGVDPWRYKLAAFVGAACIAGGSGALYPMLRGFVSPELMFFNVSGQAVINVIVGGTGSLIGPLWLGAADGAALGGGLVHAPPPDRHRGAVCHRGDRAAARPDRLRGAGLAGLAGPAARGVGAGPHCCGCGAEGLGDAVMDSLLVPLCGLGADVLRPAWLGAGWGWCE